MTYSKTFAIWCEAMAKTIELLDEPKLANEQRKLAAHIEKQWDRWAEEDPEKLDAAVTAIIRGFDRVMATASAQAVNIARRWMVDSNQAIAGVTGECLWFVYPDTGCGHTLQVFGCGKMADTWVDSKAPWNTSWLKIRRVLIEDDVTYVGCRSFENMASIERVRIGRSVQLIGSHAFERAAGIKTVLMPRQANIGPRAFYGCPQIVNIGHWHDCDIEPPTNTGNRFFSEWLLNAGYSFTK